MRKAVGGGVPLEVGGLGANKCTANRILVAASVWALGTSFADRVYSVGQPGHRCIPTRLWTGPCDDRMTKSNA